MALKALVSKVVVMLLGIFTSVEQLVTDLPEAGTGILIRERSAHKPVEAEALQRSSFPKDMVFGVASSAYQVLSFPCLVIIQIDLSGPIYKLSVFKKYLLSIPFSATSSLCTS